MEGRQEEDGPLSTARQELAEWKSRVEKAMDKKDALLLEKLDEDEKKKRMQQEVQDCLKEQEECHKRHQQSLSSVQERISKLEETKKNLLRRLEKSHAQLEAKKAESVKLKRKFKIITHITHTDVNFLGPIKEEMCESAQPIRGVFTFSQRPAVLLQGGQALITFEEEKVASQVLRLGQCSVKFEETNLRVRPQGIHMDPSAKFEIHLNIDRKQLKVFNVAPSMAEERVKDRLEISFSRASVGGGEVEQVEYDKNTGTGTITFLHPQVSGGLVLRGHYQVDLQPPVMVQVGPVFSYQLRRFQTFHGSVRRTVLLEGITNVGDEEDLQDHLEIHFQKPSNSGGEIEKIKYVSRDALMAFFNESAPNNGSSPSGQ